MASDDDGMPPERDVKEFKFQQLCKVQVSEKWQGQSSPRSQLLTCSSKYGLTFVAVPGGMKVLKTADISQKDSQHAKDKNTVIIKDCPVWTAVELQQNLSHIALNCDEQLLMTVAAQNNIVSATFYLVSSFGQQNGTPVVVGTCQLGGSGLMLSDAAWNPAIPQLLAVCLSDGSVSLITISQQMSVTAKIPPTAQATCLCWSPKGKQLVVGKLDGTLSQYDQAGTEKKQWPIPSCLPSPQARVVDVVWESTHMFVGVYMPLGSTESDQPHVIITNAPKDGNVSFVSFEDLCFGSGEGITPKYFKAIIPKWEMMVLCSASSSSATILGKSPATQSAGVWERWNLEDSGRAELPLNEEYADTFPLGMAIDYSSQLPIILEDKSNHPPCPLLLLLSTEGQLVPFYMVYTLQGAPALTSPPETLPGGTTLTGIQPAKPTTTTGLLSSATSQQPNPPSTVAKSLFGVPASSPAPAALFGDATKSGFTFGGAVPSTVAPTSVPSQTSSGVKPFLTGSEASTQGYQFPGFGANTGRNPIGSQQSPALTLGQTSQSSDSFGFGQSGPSMAFVGRSQGASTEITSSPFGQANSTPAVSSTPIGQSRPVTMATPVQQPPKQTAPLAQPIPVSQSKAPAQQTILSQPGQAAAARLGQSVTTTSQQPQQQTQSSLKRPQETPLSQTSTPTDATPIDEQKTETINKAVNSEFTRLIQEEMAHFQREINDLRERAGRTCTQIGSSEDRNKLVQSTNSMCEFSDGVRETTQTQHKEIQDLKSQLLDLFSVVEETRIQQQRNNDNKYRHLLQSRSLDPASADKMRQLSQQYQGVERGVEDLDLVLDNQWEEYLLNKKQSNKRLQRPTFDSLYRVVRMHDNLIVGQKKNIDRVQGAVKQLRLYNKSSTLASPARTNQSSGKDRDINLSSLADSLLEKSNTPVDRPQPARPQGLSPEKEAKLREFLCNRTPRTIKSSRPDMSMSKIVSSPAVRKRLTELETSLSADNAPSDSFKSTATGMMSGVSQTRPMLSNQASVPQTQRIPSHLSGQVTAPPAGLTESYPQGSLASVSGSRLNGNGTGFSGIPNQRPPSVTDVSETNDVGETRTPVISEIGSEEYLAEYGAGDADGEQYDAGYYDEDDETADDETADEETEQEPLESYSESDAAGELAQTNSAFSFTSDGSTAPGAFFLTGVQTAKPSTVTRNLFGTTSLPAFGSAGSVSGSATVSTGASGFSLGVNTVPISGTLAQKPSAPSVSSASGTIVSSGTAKPEQTGFSFGLSTSGSSAFMGQASDNNKGLQGILPKPVAFGQVASNDSKSDSVSTKPSSQVASATATTLSTTVSRSFNAQPEETSTLQAAASEDQAIGQTSGTEAAKVQEEKKAEGASGFNFGSSSSGFSFGGTGFSFKNTGAFQGAMGGTVTVLASGEGESVPTASSQAKSETPFGDAPVPTTSTATTSAPANSSGGLFGSAGSKTTTASSAAGLFVTKTSTASSTGLFGSTQSSASSANELAGEAVAAGTASTTTDGGLFGMPAVSAAGGSGLFGTRGTATTTSASLFGSATTTTTAPSLFGNTATTSASGVKVFGTTTTTAASGGLFGAVTTTTTAPSLFGNTATTSASGVGVFGTTTTTAAGGGLSGATEGTGTSSPVVLGSSNTISAATTTSSGGLFGSSITSTAATTTSASIFGSNTPASASGGLFGSSSTTSAAAATTTSASIFGSNTQASTGGGLFGSSSTTSAPGGLFGSSSSTSAGGGLFGKPSVTQSSSAGGLFGSSSTEATTTAAGGLFGSSLPATSSGGGLFGASSTNQPGGGIFGASSASTTSSSTLFGSSTTTTASSLFGSTTTTSSGGLFGSGATTTVASGGLFGSTTTTQAPGGGVFGSATPSTTTSGSVFGSVTTATSGGSSLFGANTVSNTGTSVFGSNTTATSGSSTFGSTAASTGTGGFSFGGTTAPSSGGGFLGGLGGRPTAENASKNVFGSSSFGTATSSTTNLFGSGGASGFGGGFGSSTSQASAGFGSGVNVASQGFGVAQTAQQATFGGSPAFGSNPSFGGSPAFGGGSAAFGSSPVFGGNKPVFGGASTFGSPPAPGGSGGIFGGGSATSAGFAGLANSNSPTFGSLAHQQTSSGFGEMAQQAQAPAPSFGSPGFGAGQPAGFGSPSFGSSPAFTGYRS